MKPFLSEHSRPWFTSRQLVKPSVMADPGDIYSRQEMEDMGVQWDGRFGEKGLRRLCDAREACQLQEGATQHDAETFGRVVTIRLGHVLISAGVLESV